MLTFIYCFQISPVAGSPGQIRKYGGGSVRGWGGILSTDCRTAKEQPRSMRAGWEPALRPTLRASVSCSSPAHPHPPCPNLPPPDPSCGLPWASSLTPRSSEHPCPGLTRPCASLCPPAARPAILLQLFGGRLCSQRNKSVHEDGSTVCVTWARPWRPDVFLLL